MNKVRLAREFARKKHLHQFRKDCKTPYFNHLDQVVKRLKKLGINNQDILCAGWLHDTIEDTNTDYDDISKKFGRKVADIVASLTKDNRLPKIEREKKYRQQLRHSTWKAKIVKLGDIISNISDLEKSGYDKEKKIKLVKDKLVYFNAIKSGIISNKSKLSGLETVEGELNNLLSKYGYPSVKF